MHPLTINYIKNNQLLYNYLREESKWYKELNRDPLIIKHIEELAKKYYKKSPEDKIENIKDQLELVSTLIDVLN